MDHVVIVGAGFGGLTAAEQLARRPVRVTIVDRHNYHLFQPLLYQVATAELNPQDIAHSVRAVFRSADNIAFRMAHATGVDWERRQLLVDAGRPLDFDYLIVAAGTTTNTLGIDGVAEHTYPLKTLADAVQLRDHILAQCERADVDPGLADRGGLTTVVVGAGPTGTELCGALVELFDRVLLRDFHGRIADRARVVLVEALPHVLHGYTQRSRTYASDTLAARGVDVLLDSPLAEVGDGWVRLADGQRIQASTIVWTAGVTPQPLADRLGVAQTPDRRVVVDDDLSIPGHPEAFVVGDMAGAVDPDGNPYPQMAPAAIQQARHAARQIALRRAGREPEPFRYTDRGTMATIGRNAAVAELPGGIRLSGPAAWLAWLALHLAQLIGFRNRASVLLNWGYNYLTYQRAARLIIRGDERPRRTPGDEADAAVGTVRR